MKTASRLLAGTMIGVAMVAAVAAFWPSRAAAVDFFPGDLCTGKAANSAACSADGKDPLTGPNGVITRATKIIALIGGIAAIFAIIIGGFQFITAGGDSGKISSAKKILTYSIVGLIVIALARTIIVFVVSRL